MKEAAMRAIVRPVLDAAMLLLPFQAFASAATEPVHARNAEWVTAHRAAADLMIARLDMTSFQNSIGPRRLPGKTSLAAYGFTRRRTFDDGWAYATMADGSWEVGIFVLEDGRRTKLLCVTDSAIGGGTYHATTAIEVAPRPDGAWAAVRVRSGVRGCS